MTERRCIFLRPIDRVFFGAPRSQVAGEQHVSRSEFPPSPFTVAGMIRTHLLEGAEPALDLDSWSAADRQARAGLVGTSDKLPAGWKIVGPFPAQQTGRQQKIYEPWLPVPAWLTWGEDRHWHPPKVLAVTNPPPLANQGELKLHGGDIPKDVPGPLADDDRAFGACRIWIGSPGVRAAENAPAWVSARQLARLLSAAGPIDGSTTRFPSREPPFVKREDAPGVAIDAKSGTATDGMLYTLGTLRFAPASGLLVWLDASVQSPLRLSSLDRGVGRAGRKGQMAAFESAEGCVETSWDEILAGEHLAWQDPDASFWLYLATPARMDDPMADAMAAVREQASSGITVSLVAAAIGEPQIIGGLRMDGGTPRGNRAYARAGSGWLLRVEAGSVDERTHFLRQLHGRATLGPKEERAFGFGFTLVGRGPRLRHAEVGARSIAHHGKRSQSV